MRFVDRGAIKRPWSVGGCACESCGVWVPWVCVLCGVTVDQCWASEVCFDFRIRSYHWIRDMRAIHLTSLPSNLHRACDLTMQAREVDRVNKIDPSEREHNTRPITTSTDTRRDRSWLTSTWGALHGGASGCDATATEGSTSPVGWSRRRVGPAEVRPVQTQHLGQHLCGHPAHSVGTSVVQPAAGRRSVLRKEGDHMGGRTTRRY